MIGSNVVDHERHHVFVRASAQQRDADRPLTVELEAVLPFGVQLFLQPDCAVAAFEGRPTDRQIGCLIDDLVRDTVDFDVAGA